MKLTHVIKHRERLRPYYDVIYHNANREKIDFVRRNFNCFPVCNRYGSFIIVSDVKNSIVNNTAYVNGMYLLFSKLLSQFPEFLCIRHVDTTANHVDIDANEFRVKTIEAGGLSSEFRVISKNSYEVRVSCGIVAYRENKILDGSLTEDVILSILRYAEGIKFGSKECTDTKNTTCEIAIESLEYAILMNIKDISEDSCAAILEDRSMIKQGGMVLATMCNNSSTIKHVVNYLYEYRLFDLNTNLFDPEKLASLDYFFLFNRDYLVAIGEKYKKLLKKRSRTESLKNIPVKSPF